MNKPAHAVKRLFDLLAILLASPLLIPFYIIIALLMLITDKGPVLFAQERAGMNMKPFTLYKFRTMRTDVDPFGPSPKDGIDPRLTPVGKWLRKFSLDELPQIYNVLKGDMSLVGPRPLYMIQAKEWDENQRRRLNVKPGLTGIAQISGRGSLTIEEKIDLDLKYVDNQSLWLDLRIILGTCFSVFFAKDIYEKRYSKDQETRQSNTPGQ